MGAATGVMLILCTAMLCSMVQFPFGWQGYFLYVSSVSDCWCCRAAGCITGTAEAGVGGFGRVLFICSDLFR